MVDIEEGYKGFIFILHDLLVAARRSEDRDLVDSLRSDYALSCVALQHQSLAMTGESFGEHLTLFDPCRRLDSDFSSMRRYMLPMLLGQLVLLLALTVRSVNWST
jgi:hypothetical protein